MKALSIRQPWASLILSGVKPIENRTWPAPYRGRILVHAGRTLDYDCPADLGRTLPDVRTLPLGALLGTVELVDCVRVADLPAELRRSPYASGPWCWVFRDPRPLASPIPCKGKLRLWDVDPAVAARVEQSYAE
jgi:hypothetical protein